tara:strand:+ start:48 stop:329 length:282 start_codon:yes stop_codon:yes gene_type:complete
MGVKKLLLLILLLIFSCEEPIIEGCTTSTACNYDADAGKDDGGCIYPQGCNEWCDGDTTFIQIKGQVFTFSDALELDECGICGGDGSSCSQDD